MPERCIRFTVTDGIDRRSDIWKCWTVVGKGKKDVYMTCRALSGAIKLSMHESGQWHVGFNQEIFPGLFDEKNAPASRFLGQWNQPNPTSSGLVLAARVQIPWFTATTQDYEISDPKSRFSRKQIISIPVPLENTSVECAIFLVGKSIEEGNWPGRNPPMNTSLVGMFELDGGREHCAVVHYLVPFSPPKTKPAKPMLFKGAAEDDLVAGDNWGVFWGDYDDGSIGFYHGPVEIKKTEDLEA